MPTLFERRLPTVALAAMLVALGACDEEPMEDPTGPEFEVTEHFGGGFPGTRSFEVYTQNVYLGGDTGPLFSIDFNDIPAVLTATNVFWGQVQQSAAPERMAEIVSEIALRRPDVVGLQEVFQFGVLDSQFQPVGGVDLLAEIEGRIAARGLPYVTEIVQEATSSALPLAVDPATGQVTQWLSFTDRVVVLRRDDVEVTASESGVYQALVPLGPLDITRGWAHLTVNHRGTPHHFVTTHLESQSLAPVQAGQLQELLGAIVADLDGVTIVSGDLNSDAAAEEGVPSWTPTYDALIAAGFTDTWTESPGHRWRDGFTCCNDPDLRNRFNTLDQRIDFVLVRTEDGEAPRRGHLRADVVGDRRWDRTPSGLWPSDHAGIVASVRAVGRTLRFGDDR